MKLYTMYPASVAMLLKIARQAHTRAIGWKKRSKAGLKSGDSSTMWYHERYLGERSYANAIMLSLGALREHKSAMQRKMERMALKAAA